MASDWNRLLERLLELDLSAAALKLAIALARYTLGYRRLETRIGRQLLRDLTGLHGRSIDRALAELVTAGLVQVEPGARGRGHRTTYRLLLPEKAAPERPFPEERKGRADAAENAAPERPRRGNREGKNSALTCAWAGFARDKLTPAQLTECACPACAEWLAYAKRAEPAEVRP